MDINTTDMYLVRRFGVRGEADPHGVGVVVNDLRSVNVRIGVRCGRRSWDLRGPDRSFATFRAGVVRELGGVGGRAERLSSSLVLLIALVWCSSLLFRRLFWC